MDSLKIHLEKLKKEDWSEKELENVELIVDFIQHLMNNHDFDYINRAFGNGSYTQHNRNMHDGIPGVIGTVKQLVRRYPDYSYDVKHIFADGDYVMFHSHATLRKSDRGNDQKGMNIKDTWKLKDGNIVEHWDAIQPLDWTMRLFVLLNGGTIRNSNGVF